MAAPITSPPIIVFKQNHYKNSSSGWQILIEFYSNFCRFRFIILLY